MIARFQLKKGVAANINAAATKALAVEGEQHWTTDTQKLYVFSGVANANLGVRMDSEQGTSSGTLTAGTTTVVTDAKATATSVIVIQPTSAAITLLGVYVSGKAAGNFTLTHGVAAGTETFDYLIIN